MKIRHTLKDRLFRFGRYEINFDFGIHYDNSSLAWHNFGIHEVTIENEVQTLFKMDGFRLYSQTNPMVWSVHDNFGIGNLEGDLFKKKTTNEEYNAYIFFEKSNQ